MGTEHMNMKKGVIFQRKIQYTKGSYYVNIPQPIAETLGIDASDDVNISLTDSNTLEVEVAGDD